jgi:hypothetical protein
MRSTIDDVVFGDLVIYLVSFVVIYPENICR